MVSPFVSLVALLFLPNFLLASSHAGSRSGIPQQGGHGSRSAQHEAPSRKETQSLGRQLGIPADFRLLRDAERNTEEAVFTHGKELLEAISLGVSHFEVFENRTRTADMINLNDYEEMSKTFLYDAHTSYTLKSDLSLYLNLDNPKHMASFGSIHELSDSHVVQCGHDTHIKDGTFLVGSSRGLWSTEPAVAGEIARSMAHLHPIHLSARKEQGLTMIRKVIRSEDLPMRSDSYEVCSKLHTESVHPLELFSNMRIQTITESPYHHIYKQKENAADNTTSPSSQNLRKELSTIVFPDYPIACSGTDWGYALQGGGYGYSYAYELGLTAGCAEYSIDLPGSFSFNHDPLTGSAIHGTYTLANGVSCVGCYAYLGAGLLAIVEYGFNGDTFDLEAKAGGGVGFSLTVAVSNPTLSASSSFSLLSAEPSYTIIGVGSGLFLGYKFGGLIATVSGSGSATGDASFSDTQDVSASIGIEYLYENWAFPRTYASSSSPATYTHTAFKATSFSASLELTGTENFVLSYSGYVSFYFDANLAGSVGAAVLLSSNAVVSILDLSNARTLSETPQQQNILETESLLFSSSVNYLPGDIVPIRFEYSGYNPLENTFLFYSVEKSDTKHPIMQRNFTTSETGSGYFDANWTVPWDYSLAGEGLENTQIIMSASNMIFDLYRSPSFGTTLFTDNDGIFLSPAAAEIVPVDTPYLLRWSASLLFHFEPSHWGSNLGSEVASPNVTFVLFAEKMSANGTAVISKYQYHNITVGAVPNNGECTVIFPSRLSAIGDRFYIVVKSVLNDAISGWSKNYFTLGSKYQYLSPMGDYVISVDRKLRAVPVHSITDRSARGIKLASCATTTAVTVGLNSGMSSGDVEIFGYGVGLKSYSQSYPLFSPSIICLGSLADTPAPTPSPSFQPTSLPSARPTNTPSAVPTYSPSKMPTANPSGPPTVRPSVTPTSSPSTTPSASPSQSPSAAPSVSPTISPSKMPTVSPSVSPTSSPSTTPSASPSQSPSATPSVSPTISPSKMPTVSPTVTPTSSPSTTPSASPSQSPSVTPSVSPTISPSKMPTVSPTVTPTSSPSTTPTVTPSMMPTGEPTAAPTGPTYQPSTNPTQVPTVSPPTGSPSDAPSGNPTVLPTMSPSATPTTSPSNAPTVLPTMSPSATPTTSPSNAPTVLPTMSPSATPTTSPSNAPTVLPTMSPSATPTTSPSNAPTETPSITPSSIPTIMPTQIPSFAPSSAPSIMTTASPSSAKPTHAPTVLVVASISVTQTISGVNATVAQSPAFKTSLQSSIASVVGVNKTNVHITSITSSTTIVRNLKTRSLVTSAASVQYEITTLNGALTTSALMTVLATAISSGTLTAAIQASSPSLASVSASQGAVVTDISPTSSPTYSPSLSPTAEPTKGGVLSTPNIIAIIAGSVGGGLVAIVIGTVIYFRRYPINLSN